VNPYLGGDSLKPFTDRADRGVIALCRTSNPGARDIQDLISGGTPVYEILADLAAREWNANGNLLLVVGATYPEELGAIRRIVGDMPLLVPGVGAQGGDVAEVMRVGCDSAGYGLMISSSRDIIYASDGTDFADKSRAAAEKLRTQINACRA
jgi:orotidine-5'-phosphate decarboxylase